MIRKGINKLMLMTLTVTMLMSITCMTAFAADFSGALGKKSDNTDYTYADYVEQYYESDSALKKYFTNKAEEGSEVVVHGTNGDIWLKNGVNESEAKNIISSGYKQRTQNISLDEMLNPGQSGNIIQPDTVGAMNSLQGVIPVVNIILGVVCVIITLLLAIYTAFDVCYISFPAFRNTCDEQAGGPGASGVGGSASGRKAGVNRFVTDEARWAVEKCSIETGQNPLTAYLKKRVIAYIAVSLILFILLTGNINVITNLAIKIVAYVIDVIRGL